MIFRNSIFCLGSHRAELSKAHLGKAFSRCLVNHYNCISTTTARSETNCNTYKWYISDVKMKKKLMSFGENWHNLRRLGMHLKKGGYCDLRWGTLLKLLWAANLRLAWVKFLNVCRLFTYWVSMSLNLFSKVKKSTTFLILFSFLFKKHWKNCECSNVQCHS